MPNGYLTAHWSRQLDERAAAEYGMSGLVLMENAGRGCADLLQQIGVHGPVVLCCGKGNNAGDGFVIARHLELRGIAVQVLLWSDPQQLRGDASVNFEILRRAETPFAVCPAKSDKAWVENHLRGADWIVDAILGSGSTGAPRAPFDAVIDIVNQSSAKKLAVDLPSGLDCDRGFPSHPTVRADHTATFVAPKSGFHAPQAQEFLGTVHVVDIGAPLKLVHEVLAACNATFNDERSVS